MNHREVLAIGHGKKQSKRARSSGFGTRGAADGLESNFPRSLSVDAAALSSCVSAKCTACRSPAILGNFDNFSSPKMIVFNQTPIGSPEPYGLPKNFFLF